MVGPSVHGAADGFHCSPLGQAKERKEGNVDREPRLGMGIINSVEGFIGERPSKSSDWPLISCASQIRRCSITIQL